MPDQDFHGMVSSLSPTEMVSIALRFMAGGDDGRLEDAYKLLQIACQQGSFEAMAELGLMQVSSNCPWYDFEQGLKHLEVSYLMGHMGSVGTAVQAIDEGIVNIESIRDYSQNGNGFCTFLLAMCTLGGIVETQSDERANALMNLALEQECPSAILASVLLMVEHKSDDAIRMRTMLDDAISITAKRYGSVFVDTLAALRCGIMERHHARYGCLFTKIIGAPEQDTGLEPDAYVESFLDGHLFMKCLDQFANLEDRDESSSNDFRGDPLEGCAESFGCGYNPYLYKTDQFGCVQDGILSAIDLVGQRKKVLCLSLLDFDPTMNTFETISPRMEQFGEYAVVVTDPKELIRRVEMAVNKLREERNTDYCLSFGPVKYDLSLQRSDRYDEFNKSPHYSWQNEFRFSIDFACGRVSERLLNEVTDFAKLTFPGELEIDTDELSMADVMMLEVGSIRDICRVFSVKELLRGPHMTGIAGDILEPIEEHHERIGPRPTFCKGVAGSIGEDGDTVLTVSKEAYFSAVL